MNIPLHLFKPHSTALLALKVVDDSSQGPEVLAAVAAVGAVVQVLLVSWRIQMLIQPMAGPKPLVTQITLPLAPVPGPIGTGERRLGGTLPADEFLRDQAARVLGPDELVDGVPVQRGCVTTASALEMVGHARGGSIAVGAEGAFDFLATVGAGVEVLVA